jgi:hypothetical protein
MGFWAEYTKGKKHLSWYVNNEQNIKEYRLYVSKEGTHYELTGIVPFSEFQTDQNGKLYTFTDETTYYGVLYYKLEVINHENQTIKSLLKDINLKNWLAAIHYFFDDDQNLIISPHDNDFPLTIQLTDLSGKTIHKDEFQSETQSILIPKEKWGANRMVMLSVINNNRSQFMKIILP